MKSKPESIRKDCEYCGASRSAHKRIANAWACKSCAQPIPRGMLMVAYDELATVQADMVAIFNLADKYSGLDARKLKLKRMGTERGASDPDCESMSERDAIEHANEHIASLQSLVKHYGCYGASKEHWESPEGKAFSRDVATLVRTIKIIQAGGAGQLFKSK